MPPSRGADASFRKNISPRAELLDTEGPLGPHILTLSYWTLVAFTGHLRQSLIKRPLNGIQIVPLVRHRQS